MDQYAINIHGNSGSVNINFEELAYRLGMNEIMAGQQAGFPIKKNIAETFNFNDNIINDFVFDKIDGTVKPTTDYIWQIQDWIETKLGEEGSPYNSAVSFVIDLYFRFNHFYNDRDTTYKHFAGSMHKQIAFNVYKPNINSSNYIYSAIETILDNGTWVEYDSSSSMYGSILDSGELDTLAFPVSLSQSVSPTKLLLKIENDLRTLADFSNLPDYEVEFSARIRAFEYSKDSYSSEII